MYTLTPPHTYVGRYYPHNSSKYPNNSFRLKPWSLFLIFALVSAPAIQATAAEPTSVVVDGSTLIISGEKEFFLSDQSREEYTVTETGEKVNIKNFDTVIFNGSPTGQNGWINSPYSFRYDAPEQTVVINLSGEWNNCNGIHLTNYGPYFNVGKYVANINSIRSEALSVSHDTSDSHSKIGEVDITVTDGNGIRANSPLAADQGNFITIEEKAKFNIHGDSGGNVLLQTYITPTAVYAGSDTRILNTPSKGYGRIDLNGSTEIYLHGKGNYGLFAGRNGFIYVNDLYLVAEGDDSYGVAATDGNITYGSFGSGEKKYGSVITMTGDANTILMTDTSSRAIYATKEDSKVVSGQDGIGSLTVRGAIEANSSGVIDLYIRGQVTIDGTISSSSKGEILMEAAGGFDISSIAEEEEYPTVIYAGDTSNYATGTDIVDLKYGATSSLRGDIVAIENGEVNISPIEAATNSRAAPSDLTLTGDAIAANGGTINLRLGNGSYWSGRTDDYKDADSPDWSDDHSSIFTPTFSTDVESSGKVNVDLGSNSTWFLTGQSWVTSLKGDNNVINLTDTENNEGNFALHIGEISGGNNTFVMNISSDGSGNMLYVYNGTSSSQNLVIANADEVLEMNVGERVRFATVANAGNGFIGGSISDAPETGVFGTRTTVANQGVFNVDYAIEYVDRATDNEAVDYDGGSSMSSAKPGADYVSSIYDSPENANSQNVYIVRTGNSTLSNAGETIMATSRATYWNAVLIDRWNQRYGERVYDRTRNGVWARVKHERLGTNEGVGDFRSYNTMYQFGYDYSKPTEHGKMIWGVAVDYMDGRTDYKSIEGDGGTDRTALSLYATYLTNTGFYGDLVFRAGRLSSDFKMYTPNGVKLDVDYDNWLYGLSFETGHQLTNNTGWFVEPQIQAQYIRITSGDYTTQQNTRVEQDAIDSFIGRAGFRVGKFMSDDKANLGYFKADVLREFLGKQKIHVADRTTGIGGTDWNLSNHGTWFDVGAGFQAVVAEDLYAYGDLEYRFGNDLERTWVFNLGAKYRF